MKLEGHSTQHLINRSQKITAAERFKIFKDLFIYLWLRWVFTAVRGLSLVVVSRGYSLAVVQWLVLLQSTGSRVLRLQ